MALTFQAHKLVALDDLWAGEKMLCWPVGEMPWNAFPTLSLHLAISHNTSFQLLVSPRQYLREVAKDTNQENVSCFKFAIASSHSGQCSTSSHLHSCECLHDSHLYPHQWSVARHLHRATVYKPVIYTGAICT